MQKGLLLRTAPRRNDGRDDQANTQSAKQASDERQGGLLKKEHADTETEEHAPADRPGTLVSLIAALVHSLRPACHVAHRPHLAIIGIAVV